MNRRQQLLDLIRATQPGRLQPGAVVVMTEEARKNGHTFVPTGVVGRVKEFRPGAWAWVDWLNWPEENRYDKDCSPTDLALYRFDDRTLREMSLQQLEQVAWNLVATRKRVGKKQRPRKSVDQGTGLVHLANLDKRPACGAVIGVALDIGDIEKHLKNHHLKKMCPSCDVRYQHVRPPKK